MVKNSLANTGNSRDMGSIPGLGKKMATHSSILIWKIPWTEEPGGLHSSWGHKRSDMTEHS